MHTDITMKTDPDEIVPVLFRIPRWMVEGLEKESEALSERAGGVPVSRNAALVAMLRKQFGDRRRKETQATEKNASPLLRKYKLLHEQGRVSNTSAAQAIGVSEATIRRWVRGETSLGTEKEAALASFVESAQLALHTQKTLGIE